MINGGVVTGPFDIKFSDNGLLEEKENGGIRITALGHVYFALVTGDYAKTQCPGEMQLEDEMAFHEELGLVEVRGALTIPLPFGINKAFKELEFDELNYEFAVAIMRAHPEFESMVNIKV